MSGRGVTIPIAADATEAIRASKQTAGALDDVVDELDKVDRAGAAAATPATKGLDKAADQAADTTRTLRTTRDALGDLETAGHAVGDPAAASMSRVRKSTDDAGEGMKAFKENAQSNLKETAASFTDVDSAIGGMQGFLAEALEGLGPLGVAAGAGIATGLGIAQAALQATADKVNAVGEQAAQLAKTDLATTDQTQRLAAVREQLDTILYAVKDARSWWEIWQKSAVTGAEQIAHAASEGSTAAGKFVEAFDTGDPVENLRQLRAALADSQERVDALTDAESARFAQTRQFAPAADEQIKTEKTMQSTIVDSIALAQQQVDIEKAVAAAHGQTVDEYKAAQVAAEQHTAAVQAGRDAAEAYRSAVASTAEPADVLSTVLDANTQAMQTWAQEQADATKSTKDKWQDYATTVTATLDQVLTELSGRVAAEQQFQSNLAALGARGFGALAESLRAGGPATNGAMVALLASGTDAQVQQYANDQGYLTGQNLGKGAALGMGASAPVLQDAITRTVSGLSLPVLTFRAQLDTGQVDAEMRRLANTPGTIEYKARIGQKGVM